MIHSDTTKKESNKTKADKHTKETVVMERERHAARTTDDGRRTTDAWNLQSFNIYRRNYIRLGN